MILRILKRIFARQKIVQLKFYITKNKDKTYTIFSTHDQTFALIDDPGRVYRFVNEIMQRYWYIDLYDYSCLFNRDDPISTLIDAMELREDFEKKLRFDATTIFQLGVYFK